MEFSTSPHVGAFAAEVRAFLAEFMTDEVRERMHRTHTFHDDALVREMGRRGWLAAALPGSGRDPFELAALFDELERAGAPYHGISTSMMVAGVLARTASPWLQERVLPDILAGEAVVALGYSEPDHGSDVAAAATRAVPTDAGGRPGWVINGQKMWTSLAHVARYVLLLTRTNTGVPKHKGLTMFLVPTDTPGFSLQPVHTMGSERTNVTFYDDLVLGDEWRVGDVDGGWPVMGVALGLERGVMGGTTMGVPLWEHARGWAAGATDDDGRRLLDDPLVRERFALARIDNEVAWLLTQRSAWLAASGGSPGLEGSAAKVFATEAYQKAARWFHDMAGAEGLARLGQPGAAAGGILEYEARHAPVTTIYGGTSEINRNNIAERLLGLPRAR